MPLAAYCPSSSAHASGWRSSRHKPTLRGFKIAGQTHRQLPVRQCSRSMLAHDGVHAIATHGPTLQQPVTRCMTLLRAADSSKRGCFTPQRDVQADRRHQHTESNIAETLHHLVAGTCHHVCGWILLTSLTLDAMPAGNRSDSMHSFADAALLTGQDASVCLLVCVATVCSTVTIWSIPRCKNG